MYISGFFFFYSAEEKMLVDRGEVDDFGSFSVVLLVAIFLSGLGYAVMAYRLTIRFKEKVKNNFSYSEGLSLKWLRYCISGIGLVFLTAVVVFLLRDILSFSFPFNPEYIFYSIMIAFIFYIGYFGIKQENIFIGNPVNEAEKTANTSSSEKYSKSGMKEEVAVELYGKLLLFMKEEKPYLDPRLSLSELAERLEMTNNQLSQIINQKAGVNFHDFVNSYRIDAFLDKAEKNKNYSFLALALDAGFNSKSSFNHIFKKQKGVTPSQYLSKNQRNQDRAVIS
jgi:AraC-like DNA-binding protein